MFTNAIERFVGRVAPSRCEEGQGLLAGHHLIGQIHAGMVIKTRMASS